MKARKMISSFEKGRLMSLLLFLLVSVTMQAEDPTSYGISVGNVQITSENASNVFNDAIATVSFDAEANTLTLNDAMVNGPIHVSENMALTVHLVGDNTIDGGYNGPETGNYAFESEASNATLTFTTDEENPGLLVMRSTKRDGEVPVYYNGFADNYPVFSNNLASATNDSKCLIAMKPVITPAAGLYWTDTEFSLTGCKDAAITYKDYKGAFQEMTEDGPFTLIKGKYFLAVWETVTVDETEFTLYGADGIYIIHNKPTFTPAPGSYDEQQTVQITNLPADMSDNGSDYPQVWYYLDDDKQNETQYPSDGKDITITESTKVCVYFVDEDSGNVKTSDPVEAQYIIRQDAGLAYMANEEQTESAIYVIGDEENQDLPELMNENEVTVTYSSTNTNVATVNAETGEVTIVGVGETTITATSTKDDYFLVSEASYTLTVYKDLSHSDITVTLSELTYNGQPQTPTVTVKDGEVTLTLGEHYSIIEPEVGNTNAIEATAENAPVLNINCETKAEVNYYVGSRDVKFGIAPKQLEEDMVVLSATTLPYSGENQKPTVTVSDGEIMTADDYTITNEGGVDVGEYTVTVVAKNNYTGTVEKTFSIINRTLEVGKDVNFVEGQKWASYYTTTEDLELPDGVMAYIVTAVGSEAVTVKAINYVPKNVPVLIEKESTATTENTSAEGNLLQGTTSAADVTAVAGTVYVLYNNGFTRAKSGSIPAGRAYLVLAQAAGARLSIFEETTGVKTATVVQQRGEWYTLDGRKLQAQPTKKGMYIVNGQKVVIK